MVSERLYGFEQAASANEMRRHPQGDRRQLSWPTHGSRSKNVEGIITSRVQDSQGDCETSMVAACARVEDKENSRWDESTAGGQMSGMQIGTQTEVGKTKVRKNATAL